MDPRRVPSVKAYVLIATLAGCVVLTNLFPREFRDPRKVLELVRSVEHVPWALPVLFGAYFLLTAGLVPAAVLHVVSSAAWGLKIGLIVNVLACNAAASLQFFLVRVLGRESVARFLASRDSPKLEAALGSGGFWTVLTLRFLPLPTMAVNTAAGLAGVRWRDFALASALGTFPVIFAYSYFAASIVAGLETGESPPLGPVAAGVGVIVALSILPRVIGNIRKSGRDGTA